MKDIFYYIKNDQLKDVKKLVFSVKNTLQQKDKQQNTPLIFAIANKKTKITNFLLTQKNDINAQNNIGFTALMYSTINNNILLTKKLIAQGARLNLKNNEGRNVIGIALQKKNYPLFSTLVKHKHKNKTFTKNEELLIKACFTGNIYLLKKIFKNEKNINVNLKYYFGFTPLMAAAIKGNIDILRFLIEKGAKINQKTINGNTALRISINSNYSAVKYLINNGAQINHINKQGISPLTTAIYLKKPSIIKLLLENGANPNFGKAGLINPLKTATVINNKKLFQLLKKYGLN